MPVRAEPPDPGALVAEEEDSRRDVPGVDAQVGLVVREAVGVNPHALIWAAWIAPTVAPGTEPIDALVGMQLGARRCLPGLRGCSGKRSHEYRQNEKGPHALPHVTQSLTLR